MTRFIRTQGEWLKKSTKRFFFALMGVLTATSLTNSVRLKYFEAELYFSYQGTTGPYEVIEVEGKKYPGALISSILPGQGYGWLIEYCLDQGVSVAVRSRLVRLAQGGMPEQIVDTRVTRWTPEDHRCGPIFGGWKIPDGARPGLYEVRRTLIFREGSMFELHRDLDAIHLSVTPITPLNPPVPSTNPPLRLAPSLLDYRINI